MYILTIYYSWTAASDTLRWPDDWNSNLLGNAFGHLNIDSHLRDLYEIFMTLPTSCETFIYFYSILDSQPMKVSINSDHYLDK